MGVYMNLCIYIYNPNDIPVMFVDIDQHLSTSININIYQHEYYLNTYIYIYTYYMNFHIPNESPWFFPRYSHPYEHDQKLFSAFLRFGERVAFDQELPVTAEETPSAVTETAGHALRRKSWDFPWENDGK